MKSKRKQFKPKVAILIITNLHLNKKTNNKSNNRVKRKSKNKLFNNNKNLLRLKIQML